MSKRKNFMAVLLYGVFVGYILFMASLLLFRYCSPTELFSTNRMFNRSINLTPFHEIYSFLSNPANIPRSVVINNVVGNIVVFIPLGVYLLLFRKDKRVYTNAILVCFISLSVEALQFIFGIGASDIDDVVLNCLGGIIGIFCYKVLFLLLIKEENVRTMVTILAAVASLPIFVYIVLYSINNRSFIVTPY